MLLVSGFAELARDGVSWLGISTKDDCGWFMRVKRSLNSCATSSAIDINPPRGARLSVIYKSNYSLDQII